MFQVYYLPITLFRSIGFVNDRVELHFIYILVFVVCFPVFNYVPGDHNVIVAANHDVYDKCATTPNLGIWTSGNDVLTLPTTGTYYFLCEFHCDYTEQRIMVKVNS